MRFLLLLFSVMMSSQVFAGESRTCFTVPPNVYRIEDDGTVDTFGGLTERSLSGSSFNLFECVRFVQRLVAARQCVTRPERFLCEVAVKDGAAQLIVKDLQQTGFFGGIKPKSYTSWYDTPVEASEAEKTLVKAGICHREHPDAW